MVEFEKWDKEEYPLPCTIERGPIGRDALKQRKHAWKAALKWVLNHPDLIDHYMLDYVKEELSGE